MGHFNKDPINRFLHEKKYILADASLIYKNEKNKKKRDKNNKEKIKI